MTDEELQAIEARANAATTGPWEVDQKDCTVLRAPNGPPADQSLMGDAQYYPWTPDRIEDWQFIASARTDVPALVAEVRRLRKVERLRLERAWERGADFYGLDDVPERHWKADRDRDVAKILATEITDDELTGQTNG
jgi:hypothetical protein